MLVQRLRRRDWADVVQMLYRCFVFTAARRDACLALRFQTGQ